VVSTVHMGEREEREIVCKTQGERLGSEVFLQGTRPTRHERLGLAEGKIRVILWTGRSTLQICNPIANLSCLEREADFFHSLHTFIPFGSPAF